MASCRSYGRVLLTVCPGAGPPRRLVWLLKTGKQSQGGGLPAAGGAQQREELARVYSKETSSTALTSPKVLETPDELNDRLVRYRRAHDAASFRDCSRTSRPSSSTGSGVVSGARSG